MTPVPPRFRLDSYRYRLPPERIAQTPAPDRAESRLMVVNRRGGVAEHGRFSDLPAFLRPGDCLVVNDTKVVRARLFGRKESGGRVELLVTAGEDGGFHALYGTSRGLKAGQHLELLDRAGNATGNRVVVDTVAADGTARFQSEASIADLMERYGHVPLPPYIHREGDGMHDFDLSRYQTVYASEAGAVAAPTAGLHFTENLLRQIADVGVKILRVTLHVGPGTFRPVKTDDVREHDVGEERFFVPERTAEVIDQALAEKRRIVAVGTTVVRTLETAWASGRGRPGPGATRLVILPGFRFRVVSALITNFHLPGSSLLLLVSAFAGRERILGAYREAIRQGYRFYSYGDAMFIA